MPHLRIIFFFFCCLLVAPQAAHAVGPIWPITDQPSYWLVGEGDWQISGDTDYLFSQGNYDLVGDPSYPSTMVHVQDIDLRANLGYGFFKNLTVFAQVAGNNVTAVNRTLSAGNTSVSNTGLGDSMLAFRWMFYRNHPYLLRLPTGWVPYDFLAVLEGSWVFPLYQTAHNGIPPLGDQSNDITAMLRLAWYTNDFLGLSGGAGYTYRTAQYSYTIPYFLRADVRFFTKSSFRMWTDFYGYESLYKSSNALNRFEPDPIPGGSLLYKGYGTTERLAGIGAGIVLNHSWDMALGLHTSVSGLDSAKYWQASLGFTYRPYEIPAPVVRITEKEKDIEQQKRYYDETISLHKNVKQYGFVATILKVSNNRNYFKIAFGSDDGVQLGDSFHVFKPGDLTIKQRELIAFARVVSVQSHTAFLHVENRFNLGEEVLAGYEAQRVILDE